jgi:hypothetical protein
MEALDMYFLLDFLSITQLEKIKQNGPIKIVLYINSAVDGKSHTRLSKRDDVCSEQGHFQHMYSVSAPLYFMFSEIKIAVFSILERF